MRRLLALGAAVLLSTGYWAGGHASARDQGDIGAVSPDNPLIEVEFPPIPAIYPQQSSQGGTHPFSLFRPPTCRDSTYCDAIEFTVEIPEDYREVYGVGMKLDWPENPAGNQLTLHVWPDDDPVFGGPMGPCPSPKHEDCQDKKPLFFSMVEPLPSTGDVTCPAEDCNRNPIYMTVVNSSGVNLGYTIEVHFFELELPPLPEFEDPETRFGTQTQPEERPASRERPRLEDFFANPEEVENPERPTILIPGPDGEFTELEIPLLAAGQLEPDSGRGVNPFLTAGIVAPLLGALAAYLVIRRRRSA